MIAVSFHSSYLADLHISTRTAPSLHPYITSLYATTCNPLYGQTYIVATTIAFILLPCDSGNVVEWHLIILLFLGVRINDSCQIFISIILLWWTWRLNPLSFGLSSCTWSRRVVNSSMALVDVLEHYLLRLARLFMAMGCIDRWRLDRCVTPLKMVLYLAFEDLGDFEDLL